MEVYKDIEAAVLAILDGQFSKTVFNLWFSELQIEEIKDSTVTVSTVNAFKKNVLLTHHMDSLSSAFREVLGFAVQVEISGRDVDMEQLRREAAALPDPVEEEEERRDREEKERLTELLERKEPVAGYTFDNFVVGDSNRFAHAACLAVAQSFTTDEEILTDPLEEKYNPLFIYGPSGLGKTHLLYAVTNEIKVRTPDARIVYVRGEDFGNELIESVSRNSTAEFRQKYRSADVLLIDDIHFIAGKNAIQEEFFNTFNAMYENQKQIILTSDRPPYEIKNLTDRLRTRFEWGLIADIQPPTPELRAAIIKHKAEKMGMELSPEIITYIAKKIKNNIRTIEGALRKLSAMHLLTKTPVTLDSVKKALSDVQSQNEETTFVADRIFREVSLYFDVPVDTIKGSRRQASVVYARHVCMYLLRTLTDFSLSYIGSLFGCNHANVISANNKIEEMMEKNEDTRRDVDTLTAKIKKQA